MTTTTGMLPTPAAPNSGRWRPLGLDEVRIVGGFWAHRQQINATATIPHILYWLDKEGWIANFDLAAAGALPAGRRGSVFADSEVYKTLEAMAWELGREYDAALEARFGSIVGKLMAAQEPDGYLNTAFGRDGQPARWSALDWGHELYCLGHLFQAAVARARTRPDADDGLLGVAVRAADQVCEVFGTEGIDSVCGHPEIETALVEMSRVTGDRRYGEQAQLFVERRGHEGLPDIEFGRSYYQDDIPVREATVLRGHAVRAGYLAAGAVDVAVEQGDSELLEALALQWANTVARRTYITGGQGSQHQDEAFGEDWALPPDRAYSETCAGVASIMFSWRLLLARGGAQYADLIERTLYNVIATSPSSAGTSFYYANTLHQRRPGSVPRTDEACLRAASSLRAPWFAVSCCPPNIARTLASLAAYVATADDDGVQLHQYAPSRIRTVLSDGRVAAFDVSTAYPAEGAVRLRVLEDAGAPLTLTLRVPSWAEGAQLVEAPVDGETTTQSVAPGSVAVHRAFRVGDVIELHLPVAPRFTTADPRIDAVRGCVAVERGPEVLCLESTDLPADSGRADGVSLVAIEPSVPPREVDGRVVVRIRPNAQDGTVRPWPFGSGGDVGSSRSPAVDVPLIAYHDWANRGPSTMRVWIPVSS